MSNLPDTPILPNWAPRLKKKQIARLYSAIGRGVIDDELIDDVGFSLLARCESILQATEACLGRVTCPVCASVVEHSGQKEEVLRCDGCGWHCMWRQYQKTYQHKQLVAGGMVPYFVEFVEQFSQSKSARERLTLIDTLLHRCHWEHSDRPSRPGAINLIEGRMKDIINVNLFISVNGSII
jgi:hypothetical protein